MNDQTSKKILFNKSTLFSLKAELLKKQDEVNEKKQKPQHKLENFKPAKPTDIENPTKGYKKSLKSKLKAVDTEELEACRKSKLALQKKAELYEHLSDGVGNSELAGRFLVDFNTKKQEEAVKHVPDMPSNEAAAQDTQYDGDNEWIEFTDCFGRTRKCHISDLDMYKKRDRDLSKIMYIDNTGNEDETLENTDTNTIPDKPLLVQTTNDYLQSLREKWEEKEKELLAKDKDIHYQDLLFDEARMHGVGYYGFSTDETERQKQMQELLKRRQETLRAQQEAERVRTKRDELVAARLAAARARQRARAGLPPEPEKQDTQDDFTKRLLEFLTQQKNEADAKASEEEKKAKEEIEKEKQKLREAYVREWDLGKEGVEDKVKKFREMTQEEYVEKQRENRINEFAPPQTSTSKGSSYTFDNTGRMVNPEGSVSSSTKTWEDVRPKANTPPPPPDIGDITKFPEQKGLYFSTATKRETTIKYKNFVKPQDPIPIENEVSDEEPVDDYPDISRQKHDSNHSEIAPPPTYDYYGPVPKKARSQKPFESNIREAYAQGAKSLEPKSSNRQLPQHYDFTFD